MHPVLVLLALTLTAVVAPGAAAQPPCETLIHRALVLRVERADPATTAAAARRARACLAGRSSPSLPGLFEAEAWGLVNTERWGELGALGAAFDRLQLDPRAYPDAYVTVMGATGVALVVRGQASEGLARQRHALAVLPATRPRLHATTLSSLAWSHGLLGDHASADTLYDAMEAVVTRHLYGPARRPLLLRARSERAGNLLAWHEDGRLPDAPTRLRLALALARDARVLAAAERDPSSESIARLFEGEALHYLGALDSAVVAFEAVLHGPDRTYWPYAKWDLARIDARRGRTVEAERRYRAVLTAFGQDADPERDVVDVGYELGALLEADGRTGDAETAYRHAIATLDRLLAGAGGDDQWVQAQRVWQRPYRGLARVLVRQERVPEALAALDAAKARYLMLYQARAQAVASAQTGPLAQLLGALDAARDSLARPQTEPVRLHLAARADALQARLAQATPLPHTAPLNVPALQRRLGTARQVLVAFLLDEPEPFLTRSLASYAFVVTAGAVSAVPLPAHAPSIETATDAVSPMLARGEGARLADRAFRLGALHALYLRTLGPTRSLWRGARRLVVIPDGPLFDVPLAALVTRADPSPWFLGDDVAVSTEIAAGLLLQTAPAHAPFAREALVAGRSRFAGSGLPDLPSVQREVRHVGARLARADVLLDAEATETRVIAEAPRARVLHLATHSDLTSPSPLYFALRFTPDAHDDGLLRLHELQRRSLPNALVVLSGCATARGTLRAGEGMAGLQYGFRAAGARSVVATLWLVDDAAMADLMTSFYRHLTDGQPKDVALQRAQSDYRRAHPTAGPFLWAAPVLYGDAVPVALQPSWRAHPAARMGGIGVAALAAVLAGAVAFRRRRTPRYA